MYFPFTVFNDDDSLTKSVGVYLRTLVNSKQLKFYDILEVLFNNFTTEKVKVKLTITNLD